MYTKIEKIKSIVSSSHKYFNTEITKNLDWRIKQLKAILSFVNSESQGIKNCLKQDLNQTDFLAETGEIMSIKSAANHALSNISDWTKPEYIRNIPISLFPSKAYVLNEPLGVTSIFGVWNFPFFTVLVPLISAISAGNCAIIKPSEISVHSSKFIAAKLPKYIDNEGIKIITGGADQSTELLSHKMDHVFYTGSAKIAKIVLAAAAKHLTPVTLELGGKNPVFVCDSADIKVAAKRTAWGKVQNMGQACVAPDYVLISETLLSPFCKALAESLRSFFGRDVKEWIWNKDLSRITNKNHFRRLKALLDKEKGQFIIGGNCDEKQLFITPTVIISDFDSPFMEEEIFGPILIVIPTKSLKQSIEFSKRLDKPLALYIFATDAKETDQIIKSTSSGGLCVNETLFQASIPTLPFGGVGQSGTGKNFGKWGFKTFSNERAVVSRRNWPDFEARYAPYSAWKLKIARMFVSVRGEQIWGVFYGILFVILVLSSGWLLKY